MASESVFSQLGSMVRTIVGSGSSYPTVKQKSTIDGRTYNVRDLPDKQKAADLLAKLRMRLETLMSIITEKYPDKPQVKRLAQNFKSDPDRFLESTPDAEHTSYSVNKGESVHFCLRQRNASEQLVDDNIMMFVAIHEMGHMITKSVGHEPEFWNNFGWLLREAEAGKLYTPTDFKSHPVMYCGVTITDSPKYDPARDVDKDGSDFKIGSLFS
jgi:predicted metal-dependent hydrolase